MKYSEEKEIGSFFSTSSAEVGGGPRRGAEPPRIKAILMSGHALDESIGLVAKVPEAPLLQKPFGPILLARKVREVLDGAGSAPMGRADLVMGKG